jgi:hypothetical protein
MPWPKLSSSPPGWLLPPHMVVQLRLSHDCASAAMALPARDYLHDPRSA